MESLRERENEAVETRKNGSDQKTRGEVMKGLKWKEDAILAQGSKEIGGAFA